MADKLAALVNPTPEFQDVDDEADDDVTGAKVTEAEGDEYDQEFPSERSKLRTQTAPSLDNDARYKGKKIKRKDFQKDRDEVEHSTAELGHLFEFGEDDEDEEDEDGDEDEDGEEMDQDENLEEEVGDSSDEVNEDDEAGNEDDDSEAEDDSFGVDISSFSANNDNNDEETAEADKFKITETDSLFAKSQAVSSQLVHWDKLLEQRIMLQKMLTKVNCFPSDPDMLIDPDDVDHSKLVNKANKSLRSLMMKTVQLKKSVERRTVEESRAMKRKLSDVSDWLEEEFRCGEERRRERISLWSDRTQRLGNMGSMNTPTLEQIDQITSNMARLVKRTKIARVECNVLGETNQTDDNDNASQEERQNIFDDSDFYHHLLRELIEKKTSAGSESGETGKHWLQIQKLRSKLKKKVDTRASKGRKLRYDIHIKLVNFMAPVRIPDPMPDNSRIELFSSLFGARKT